MLILIAIVLQDLMLEPWREEKTGTKLEPQHPLLFNVEDINNMDCDTFSFKVVEGCNVYDKVQVSVDKKERDFP